MLLVYNKVATKKIIIWILIMLSLIIGFYVALYIYEDSKSVTKKQALELAKPAINVILDYKKRYGKYPTNLIELKNFPYKLKQIDNNEYRMTENKYDSYTIYYYPHNNDGKKTILEIDFFDNKKVGSIDIYFNDNGSYKVEYSAGSLGPGA